jgi:hypothetical protein
VNLKLIAALLFSILGIISCDSPEIRYEYHPNKKVKIKGEYRNDKLNGLMAAYDIEGNLMEVSEWREDLRDGLTISFYPNKDTAAVYNFNDGRAFGEYKIYYEQKRLKKVGFVTDDGFVINTKSYNVSGSMLPMEPIFKLKYPTIKLGDTLRLRGTMENVNDNEYLSGYMIIGKKFIGNEHKDLEDTLAISASNFNDYKVELIPDKTGEYKFIVQFAYRFKRLNSDTLSFFSQESSVTVE